MQTLLATIIDRSIEARDVESALARRHWRIVDSHQWQREEIWYDGTKWPLLQVGLACRRRLADDGRGHIFEIGALPREPGYFCHPMVRSVPAPKSKCLPQQGLGALLRDEFALAEPPKLVEQLRSLVFASTYTVEHAKGWRATVVVSTVSAAAGRSVDCTEVLCRLWPASTADGAVTTLAGLGRTLGGRQLRTSLLEHVMSRLSLGGRSFKKKGGRLKFTASTSLATVAQQVFSRQLARMLANEAGTKVSLDPEYLHDMRVATRRLRSAFGEFGCCYGTEDVAYFDTELRWLADVLGVVRDLDVQLADIERLRQTVPGLAGNGMDTVVAMLEARWSTAQQAMRQALASERYRRFVAAFETFVRDNPARTLRAIGSAVGAETSAGIAAGELLAARLEKVLRRGARVEAKANDRRLHRLRIQCKRLRYLAEFFRCIIARETVDQFVASLVNLQDLIGEQHDAVVAVERLSEVIATVPDQHEIHEVLTGLVVAAQQRSEKLRKELPAAWKTFRRFATGRQWADALHDARHESSMPSDC